MLISGWATLSVASCGRSRPDNYSLHWTGATTVLVIRTVVVGPSWIAGIVITFLIPVPMSHRTNESKAPYFHGIIVGFIVAYFLSWTIEYWVISRFRRFPFRRLSRSMGLANAASYAAVFIAMMSMG